MNNSDPIDELRKLTLDRMENNHDSYVKAATKLGVTDAALHQLIKQKSPISVSMCLKLASYLGISAPVVLKMAGHNDIAELLVDLGATDNNDPYAQQVEEAIRDLNPEEKRAVVQNARSMAKILREQKATYIGDENNDDKPIKPHHVRNKTKT